MHLANLSFSELVECEGERPVPSILKVTPDSVGPRHYFPELYLSQHLQTPIYALERAGVVQAVDGYRWLADSLKPDAIVLVDGGTDSLMWGDEAGLGTPQEDVASILGATSVAPEIAKYLMCVGFGIDAFHGVCHAQFLENVATLVKEGGYLGAWSLTRDMDEVRHYEEVCRYVTMRMPRLPSIVNTSILAALAGEFGDYHSTRRTHGSQLFINPLMSLCWAFQLNKVAERILYADAVRETQSYTDLTLAIEKYRAGLPATRAWRAIPC